MGRILIGVTSWTEKTLVDSGLFYPPEVKTSEARLRYYAERFPLVEVDSTYYGLPTERNAELWSTRTPEGFKFDVKAFRLLTQHQTAPAALPQDLRKALPDPGKAQVYLEELPQDLVDEVWARFRAALAPLRAAGKLGAVLFQFPPWFMYRPSHLEYLSECARRMAGFELAVEFRTKSWLGERHRSDVLNAERRHGLTHVVVDEPQVTSASIPAVWEATSPRFAVVRLHGRNVSTWQKKGLASAAERFNYLYTEDELRTLAISIQRLAAQVEETHVLFNNCYRDHAIRNAVQLRGVL